MDEIEDLGANLVLADSAAYVGSNREEVLYNTITLVDAVKLSYDFTIYVRRGLLLPSRRTRVVFGGRSSRDVALARLERKLGFQRREMKHIDLRVALRPVLIGCLMALFTYVCIQAAALVAAGDEAYFYRSKDRYPWWAAGAARYDKVAQALIPVFRLLGPTGVAIVGCLAVLACVAVLVDQIRRRPVMITLSRSR